MCVACWKGIAYYIDTIIGEDNLLGTGGGSRAVTAVEDRRLRKSIVGTSVAIRAPSVSVSPYEAVFALRKLLSPWTNQVGAFAAALAIGPGGSFICSSESGVAAATESWCETWKQYITEDLQQKQRALCLSR
eukprot:SAG31_NODE_190_length_20810_cov_20.296364_3_plen_132_part_00